MSSSPVVLEQHVFRSKRLAGALDGIRILLLTDLHFRGWRGAEERALEAYLERDAADILLLGGDLVDYRGNWKALGAWLRTALAGLPCKVAVSGNWDYRMRGGRARFEQTLTEAGVEVLRNRAAFLVRGAARLAVVGLDDVREGEPDLEAAFRQVAAEDFVVVLTHSPDILPRLESYPYDLCCAGHTHGGQIRLPLWGPVHTSTHIGRRYAMGWCRTPAQRPVYVSRGIGAGVIRWRWRCRPELTAITLRCPEAPAGG